MKSFILVVAFVAVAAPSAFAQQPIRIGLKVGTQTQPLPPGTYDDGSRRDPFVSLVAPKRVATSSAAARPSAGGLRTLSINEVKVTGIQNLGTRTAMLEGPDGKTFVVRAQDRLFDGIVKSIDADGVVFTEQVADAVGAVRPRDVRKPVRTGGDGVR